MAEAGEVGALGICAAYEKAGEAETTEPCEWALPVQQRHFDTVKDGADPGRRGDPTRDEAAAHAATLPGGSP